MKTTCPDCIPCAKCRAASDIGLTGQEFQVVRLLCDGYTKNRYIASALGVTENTVKRHLSNIFDKVGCEDRLGLVLFAQNRKWITANGQAEPAPQQQPLHNPGPVEEHP